MLTPLSQIFTIYISKFLNCGRLATRIQTQCQHPPTPDPSIPSVSVCHISKQTDVLIPQTHPEYRVFTEGVKQSKQYNKTTFVNKLCVCLSVSRHPEWCPGTEGYILSSRKNIALRSDSSQSRCPVLYSNAPTYFCGQTLTFKYAQRNTDPFRYF